MGHQAVTHAWDPELVPGPEGRTHRPEPDCPVEVALAAVSGRWVTLVLRDLMHRPRSFGEIRRGLPELSAKVLTERLGELERRGLVTRPRHAGFPARTSYELTVARQRLRPLLVELYRTGQALLDRR